MGVSLCIIHYEFLFGSMTDEEIQFMSNFEESDDGALAVDEENLEEAKNALTEEQWLRLQTLISVLKGALEKANHPISLSMS